MPPSISSTRHPERTPGDLAHLKLTKIRRHVLLDGIPDLVSLRSIVWVQQAYYDQRDNPKLRPVIWKLMLRVQKLNKEDYLRYVSMGPSEVSTKSGFQF